MRLPLRLAALLAPLALSSAAAAQTAVSRCLAVAQSAPAAIPVAYIPVQAAGDEVSIRFVGHSTFLITSPEGVTIATDYNGYAGGVTPRIATMNRAQKEGFASIKRDIRRECPEQPKRND